MGEKYVKISEAAKIANVTRRTLIYYDNENILKPAFHDKENGYRYYSLEQIRQMQIIGMLKELNVPLSQIKNYIDNRNKEHFSSMIDEMMDRIQSKITILQNSYDALSAKKNSLQKCAETETIDVVFLENRDSFEVLCSDELLPSDQTVEGHFTKAYNFEKKLRSEGIICISTDSIVRSEILLENYNAQVSFFCVNLIKKAKTIPHRKIEGGLYVVGYHKGEDENLGKTYQKIFDYIKDNNLVITGDSYERNIADNINEKNPVNYMFEIAIKVSPN